MPSTVNGIGTMYFGAWNRQAQDGVCESCHARVKLVSYETWHCVCVLFVPLIPLGKKQVLDYCPSCTRHRVMPYRDWLKLREEAVAESAGQLSTSQDDPDASIQMHATLDAFQKGDEAAKLAEIMEQKFGDVARVQFYLAGWYERLGKSAEANRLFFRAFELEPNDLQIRRAALLTFVEQGDVDKAKSLLEPFLPGKDNFQPPLFYALATGFQKQGRHQEAVQTLRMLLDAQPGLKSDKTFRKALLISEKALGVEQPTIPADPFYKSAGFGWLVAAVLLVAALGGWNYYIATNRMVSVVNGLPTATISVKVDGGEALSIGPRGRTDVRLSEGPHEAEVVEPAGAHPKVYFVVKTGWWERFLRRPIFVVDPTRSAGVLWEETIYVARGQGGQAPDNRYELRLGEPFTSYKHVDYRFQEFPTELKMDSKSKRVTKTRLTVMQDEVSGVIAMALGTGKPPVSVLPFVEAHLQAKPDDDNLLQIYAGVSVLAGQDQRCRDVLSKRLADRPVRVSWHRWHQNLNRRGFEPAEARQRQEALKQTYDNWLAQEPNDASLLYLRGRLEGHGRLSKPFFERAFAANPQHPYVLYALSYENFSTGDFTAALALLRKAVAAKPNDIEFERQLESQQLAAGEFAALEKTARDELQKSEISTGSMESLLKVLVASRRVDDADREFQAFAAKYRQRAPAEFHNRLTQLEWTFAFLREDFESVAAQVAGAADPVAARFDFFAKLETDRLADIPPQTRPEEAMYWHLCRELVARRLGDAAQTAAAREAALNLFDRGTDNDVAVAEVLRQGPAAQWEDIEDLSIRPQDKAALLAVLAHEHAELRPRLLELAEKLNFDLEFPHHLVQRTIAELRAK